MGRRVGQTWVGFPPSSGRALTSMVFVWPECGPQSREVFQRRCRHHTRRGKIASVHLLREGNSRPKATVGSSTAYWHTDAAPGGSSITLLVRSLAKANSELGCPLFKSRDCL